MRFAWTAWLCALSGAAGLVWADGSSSNAIPVTGEHDFGRIGFGAAHTYAFTLENAGASPLRIRKVRSSCGCLQILAYPEIVAAGQSGELRVRLVPDKLGRVAYRAFVECGDADMPVRMVVVTAVVGPPAPVTMDGGAEPIDPALFTRVLGEPDASCYLDVAALRREQAAPGGVTLVDVRSARAYAAARIEGAVNVPLYAVKTKGFLRNRRVVLVDAGYGSPALEAGCRELRERGFRSVRVLRGGVRAWQMAGEPLAGTPRGAREQANISPGDFYTAQRNRRWLVIGLDPVADIRARYLIPDMQPCAQPGGAPMTLSDRIGSSLSAGESVTHILLTNRTGDYGSLRESELAGVKATVFFLEGGIAGFEAYLQRVTSMRHHETGSTVTGVSGPASTPRRRAACGCSS